jgi:hypothetical protein
MDQKCGRRSGMTGLPGCELLSWPQLGLSAGAMLSIIHPTSLRQPWYSQLLHRGLLTAPADCLVTVANEIVFHFGFSQEH